MPHKSRPGNQAKTARAAKASRGKRLFFGIWPDAAARRELEQLQMLPAVPGRKVPPYNFHLTLAFLGNCDAPREACCLRAAASVRARIFPLCLDQYGAFPRAGIIHLAPQQVPQELQALHRELQAALRECGHRPLRGFQPHLSLFRGVRQAVALETPAPVEWMVHSFSLIESRLLPDGARYTSVADYPLQ